MPFTTPNVQDSPTYAAQAVVDKTDLAALAAIAANNGVVSGCTVSAGGGYTVNVAAGTIEYNAIVRAVSAVTGLAPSAASSTDRRDIVVVNGTTGAVSVVAGTPTTETAVPWTTTSIYNPPVKPAVPAGSVLLAEVYIPGGGGTILSGWITDKTLTTATSQVPNSSRLVDWGHSWVAPPTYPYASSDVGVRPPLGYEGAYPWNGEQWPWALRDALGVGTGLQFTRTYQVPAVAAATDTTTFLDYMPEDGTIEAVFYVPNGAATGNNTNYRTVQFQTQNYFIATPLGGVKFLSGTNMVQGTAITLFSINNNTGVNNGTTTLQTNGIYFTAMRGQTSSALMIPQELYWSSTHTSSGLADPGGTVIVRFGTRYRNYAVPGSTLLGQGTIANAGWLSTLSFQPISRPNAVEVNTTSSSASTTTTIACTALKRPLQSGMVVNFAGGLSATLTADANFGATSITVSALASTIAANLQGHAITQYGSGGGTGETLSPSGVHTWTHGVNDANAATQDVSAWAETVRSCIARCSCPMWNWPNFGNFAYVNGGGTWGTLPKPGAGLPLDIDDYNLYGVGFKYWTGTVSGSPSVTISIGPEFEGGVVDLTVLAIAGSNLGVAGTVTVDGATPPQGSVTLNTSGVSTTTLATRTDVATSATASTTVTGVSTNFTSADIGKVFIPTGTVTGSVPAGTVITAVASTTSITLSNSVTFTATTCSVNGYFPMTKRLTGLAAGAHTVTLTITGKDSANSALILYGLGLESVNPTTPVLWCNIARVPSQTSTQKTNAAALNTASAAVIAGTASALSGNTAEPAFGNNVQYVDVDTLFGQNGAYFLDGLHLNSRGHRLIARTLFSVIRNNFTPDQLMAR